VLVAHVAQRAVNETAMLPFTFLQGPAMNQLNLLDDLTDREFIHIQLDLIVLVAAVVTGVQVFLVCRELRFRK
jgi:hypothetical protein